MQDKSWIIKPGENTNQGCGISVSDNLAEIEDFLYEFME